MGRAWWWLLAPLLVACSSGTRIVLSVGAMPEVGALETLTLDVAPDGIGAREFALSSASLPGTVVIGVPNDERQVSLRLTGRAVDTRVWTAATQVQTERGQTVNASLMLGGVVPADDMSTIVLPDMSGTPDDLTGADLTGVDLTAIPDLKPPPDLKPAVTYRRKITVTAGAALPLGYTIRVPLEANFLANAQAAGKLRVDRNDLRVRTVGGQERNRILDETPPGELPAVWFSLSSALAGATSVDYYLHYGAINPGQAPADGTAVFLIYDQFSGNTLAPTWQSNGAPVVSAGMIRFRQNQMDAITTVAGMNPLPTTACIEGRVRASAPGSTFQTVNTDQFWWWFGFQNNGGFAAADPWVIWIQRAANFAQAEVNIAGTTCAACTNMGGHTLDNQFHVYRVERNATSSVFYRDGVSSATYAHVNASQMAPLVRNYATTNDLDMDWIRGRELRAPAPTITLAAEEIVP